MARRTSGLDLVLAAVLGTSLALVAPPASAKEESKIQIRLEATGGGGGVRGDVRTKLQGDDARLALRVRGAEPETEHVLLARMGEADTDGLEVARFTTGSNGQFTGSFDLGSAGVDPRGKYLVVSDGTNDVLAGWLYGAPADDPPKTKVKEVTSLAPDATASPDGEVDARYDMRPNGHGKLAVALRGVPAGEYDLFVDGVMVESLMTNPGGNAKATFTTKPVNGSAKGKPHNRKAALDFDPRRKLIELRMGDALLFSGPMLAQIGGLNVCDASASDVPFERGPGQMEGAGTVTVGGETDCEASVEVEIQDLPAGTYDLYVDGALVTAIEVTDDGGTLSGRADFDPNPDEAGELPLDFPTDAGTTFDVFAAGETPMTGTPLLTATLP
jgi:hypothetical protein